MVAIDLLASLSDNFKTCSWSAVRRDALKLLKFAGFARSTESLSACPGSPD